MFRNPEQKVAVIVKVMFWVLSIIYAFFAFGFSMLNTLMLLSLDAAFASASSSMNSIWGSGNTYSGGGSVPLIVFNWAMAILSIIPIVLMLYYVALFLLTVAEMNTELKETKETVRDIENSMHRGRYGGGNDYYYPQPNSQPVFSQSRQQSMPFYTQPQPFYEPMEPTYEPPKPIYEAPRPYMNPQTQETQKSPEVERQKQEQSPPNIQTPPSPPEPVIETTVTAQETEFIPQPQQPESKEDILSKYGSSGHYYRKQ